MSIPAIAVLRAFHESGAAEELGPHAVAMMSAVCMQWDLLRCSRPVRWGTMVMAARTGISRGKLVRTREDLAAAGWLTVEPGRHRKAAAAYEPRLPEWMEGVPRGTVGPCDDEPETNEGRTGDEHLALVDYSSSVGPCEDEPETNSGRTGDEPEEDEHGSSQVRPHMDDFRPRFVHKRAHILLSSLSERERGAADEPPPERTPRERLSRSLMKLRCVVPSDPEKRDQVIREWSGLVQEAGITDPSQAITAIQIWTREARKAGREVRFARDLEPEAQAYAREMARRQDDDDGLREAMA